MRLQNLLALIVATLCFGSTGRAAEKPNIIYFLIDDMGFADCGFNGGTDVHTKNIDALSTRGSTFQNYYVQPLCSATRSTFLTGRLPIHHGVYGALKTHSKYGLPLNETTLAQGLHSAGYTTAITGKWHVGEFELPYRPMQRGFDHQYGLWYGQLDYFTHIREGRVDWYRDDKPCDDKGYTTQLIAKEAIKILKAQPADKPLFLYVPFNAVHAPFQTPDSYRGPYKDLPAPRQTLAAMLSVVDECIGQVMDEVHAKKMDENTLIIFSSDNGGVNPGRVTMNTPLRDGKGSIYEGGVRSCAFAVWPGKVPVGKKIAEPVHIADWYPTLLKLTGAKVEKQLPVDGVDIWPLITEGKATGRDALLLGGTQPERAAIRMGNWKLLLNATVRGGAGKGEEKSGDEEGDGAVSADQLTGKVELYNLAKDISEKSDLAALEPDRVKTMRARLESMLKTAVPSLAVTSAPKDGAKGPGKKGKKKQ